MLLRDRPAEEPFESLDLALGAALRAWVEARAHPFEVQLHGPLDAPGMDPTWLLRLSGAVLEAELALFYGPFVDVSAYRSTHLSDGPCPAGFGPRKSTDRRAGRPLVSVDGVGRCRQCFRVAAF